MNNYSRSLDGATYLKHFSTFNVADGLLTLSSTIDLALPFYKNGFTASIILTEDALITKIKIDKLSEIKLVDYYGRDILVPFKKGDILTFVYDETVLGLPKFVLNETRYELNNITEDITQINTTIGVIQESIETDVLIHVPNHGFNVQAVFVDTGGNVTLANSVTETFANGLLLPIDVDNYIVKTAGTFRVPAGFLDVYNSSVIVNAHYFLKGTKMTSVNPYEGKVQSIFKTHILNDVVYGILTLNNPIIEYVTEF